MPGEFTPYSKPSRSATLYASTGKEQPDPFTLPTPRSRDEAFTHWWWSQQIGESPGMTVKEAYHEHGMAMGLSSVEVEDLMKNAVRTGYLKVEGKKSRKPKGSGGKK